MVLGSKIATLAVLVAGSACTAPQPVPSTPKLQPGLYDPVLTNLLPGSKLNRLYKTPIYLAEDGTFIEFVYPRTGRWRVEGDELVYRVREAMTIEYSIPEFELNTLRPKSHEEGTVYRIKSPTEFSAVLLEPGTLTYRRRADMPTDELMPLLAAHLDGRMSVRATGNFREYRGDMASTILFHEVKKRRADFWRIANDAKRPPAERLLAANSCGTMASDEDDSAYASYLRAFDFASLPDDEQRFSVRRSLAMHRDEAFMPKSLAVVAEWADQKLVDAAIFARHIERRPTTQFNSILLKLLARPGESGKGDVCLALGKSGDESVRPALWEATKLPKPQDQIGALCGLIHLGPPEDELAKVVDQLLAVAPKYRNSSLMVIPALGRADVPASRKALVRWALAGPENDVHLALGALRDLNAPEYVPLLQKLAADKGFVGKTAARQHLWELQQRK